MSLTLIAAVADNNVIGKENGLIWRLPKDLKHFKEKTMGRPIIMGKKTYLSIGRVLPGRDNIILTRDPQFEVPGATIYHSLDEVLAKYKNTDNEAFVIGGAEIYKQLLPHADKLSITHVRHTFDGDTFFPPIDTTIWKKTSSLIEAPDENSPYEVEFAEYLR